MLDHQLLTKKNVELAQQRVKQQQEQSQRILGDRELYHDVIEINDKKFYHKNRSIEALTAGMPSIVEVASEAPVIEFRKKTAKESKAEKDRRVSADQADVAVAKQYDSIQKFTKQIQVKNAQHPLSAVEMEKKSMQLMEKKLKYLDLQYAARTKQLEYTKNEDRLDKIENVVELIKGKLKLYDDMLHLEHLSDKNRIKLEQKIEEWRLTLNLKVSELSDYVEKNTDTAEKMKAAQDAAYERIEARKQERLDQINNDLKDYQDIRDKKMVSKDEKISLKVIEKLTRLKKQVEDPEHADFTMAELQGELHTNAEAERVTPSYQSMMEELNRFMLTQDSFGSTLKDQKKLMESFESFQDKLNAYVQEKEEASDQDLTSEEEEELLVLAKRMQELAIVKQAQLSRSYMGAMRTANKNMFADKKKYLKTFEGNDYEKQLFQKIGYQEEYSKMMYKGEFDTDDQMTDSRYSTKLDRLLNQDTSGFTVKEKKEQDKLGKFYTTWMLATISGMYEKKQQFLKSAPAGVDAEKYATYMTAQTEEMASYIAHGSMSVIIGSDLFLAKVREMEESSPLIKDMFKNAQDVSKQAEEIQKEMPPEVMKQAEKIWEQWHKEAEKTIKARPNV